MQAEKLSRLIQLSWEIQRKKHCSRAKSLRAAWAITQNEDITIYYLVRRHSQSFYPNKIQPSDLTLFKNQ